MLEVKMYDYYELPDELKYIFFDDMATYLVVFLDGEVYLAESDSMEPEDVTFNRDLSWVPEIIKTAYRKGEEDGIDKAHIP